MQLAATRKFLPLMHDFGVLPYGDLGRPWRAEGSDANRVGQPMQQGIQCETGS